MQYGGGWQHGGGYSVRRRYTISRVEGIQCGCGTPLVWWRVCNTDQSIVSTDEGVQYRTIKIDQGVVGSCIYFRK